MCLVQCCPDTKASLIDETKRGNVKAKSENVELTLKKELMWPQKASFCSREPCCNSNPLCLFPGIENSYNQMFRISLFKISLMKLYILLNRGECVFACMINNRGWEREGNCAKREQYLDWWNKNWLKTRLSQNPLIFFICSSYIFLHLQDSKWAISLLRDLRGNHCCAQTCSS